MKFIVDGEWKCSKFFETVHDDDGNLNNILVVEPVTNVDDEETVNQKHGTFLENNRDPDHEIETNVDQIDNDEEDTNEDVQIETTENNESLGSDLDTVKDYLNEVEAVSDDVIKATLKWIGSGKGLIKLYMFCTLD